jgi:hypothetical protein
VTAAVTEAASGKGNLDISRLEAYWDVFVLVTPWVAVFTLLAYWTFGERPQMSGAVFLFLMGGLVFAAGVASFALGGPVPAEVLTPSAGGPSQQAAYVVDSLGTYVDLYGPLPPLAGVVEGGLFGYWIALLNESP